MILPSKIALFWASFFVRGFQTFFNEFDLWRLNKQVKSCGKDVSKAPKLALVVFQLLRVVQLLGMEFFSPKWCNFPKYFNFNIAKLRHLLWICDVHFLSLVIFLDFFLSLLVNKLLSKLVRGFRGLFKWIQFGLQGKSCKSYNND